MTLIIFFNIFSICVKAKGFAWYWFCRCDGDYLMHDYDIVHDCYPDLYHRFTSDQDFTNSIPIFPQNPPVQSSSSQSVIARSVCGSFHAPTHCNAGARATSSGLSCQLLLRGFLFTQPACLWTSSTAHTSSPHCPPASTFNSARNTLCERTVITLTRKKLAILITAEVLLISALFNRVRVQLALFPVKVV